MASPSTFGHQYDIILKDVIPSRSIHQSMRSDQSILILSYLLSLFGMRRICLAKVVEGQQELCSYCRLF